MSRFFPFVGRLIELARASWSGKQQREWRRAIQLAAELLRTFRTFHLAINLHHKITARGIAEIKKLPKIRLLTKPEKSRIVNLTTHFSWIFIFYRLLLSPEIDSRASLFFAFSSGVLEDREGFIDLFLEQQLNFFLLRLRCESLLGFYASACDQVFASLPGSRVAVQFNLPSLRVQNA